MSGMPGQFTFEIYAICNHVTGEAYIGRSYHGTAERWKQHWWNLRAGAHSNRALQAAWDRDGANMFGLVILQRREDSQVSAHVAEDHWLSRARAAGIVLYNDQTGRGRPKAKAA